MRGFHVSSSLHDGHALAAPSLSRALTIPRKQSILQCPTPGIATPLSLLLRPSPSHLCSATTWLPASSAMNSLVSTTVLSRCMPLAASLFFTTENSYRMGAPRWWAGEERGRQGGRRRGSGGWDRRNGLFQQISKPGSIGCVLHPVVHSALVCVRKRNCAPANSVCFKMSVCAFLQLLRSCSLLTSVSARALVMATTSSRLICCTGMWRWRWV